MSPNREVSQCELATAVCPLPEAPKTYLLMEKPQPITPKHSGLANSGEMGRW